MGVVQFSIHASSACCGTYRVYGRVRNGRVPFGKSRHQVRIIDSIHLVLAEDYTSSRVEANS